MLLVSIWRRGEKLHGQLHRQVNNSSEMRPNIIFRRTQFHVCLEGARNNIAVGRRKPVEGGLICGRQRVRLRDDLVLFLRFKAFVCLLIEGRVLHSLTYSPTNGSCTLCPWIKTLYGECGSDTIMRFYCEAILLYICLNAFLRIILYLFKGN